MTTHKRPVAAARIYALVSAPLVPASMILQGMGLPSWRDHPGTGEWHGRRILGGIPVKTRWRPDCTPWSSEEVQEDSSPRAHQAQSHSLKSHVSLAFKWEWQIAIQLRLIENGICCFDIALTCCFDTRWRGCSSEFDFLKGRRSNGTSGPDVPS